MTDVTPAAAPATPPDTPIPAPPSRLDVIKGLIGDLARPFSIYATAFATAHAIYARAPADVVGAAGVVVVALAGTKAVENVFKGRQDAQVQIAASGAASQ